MQKNQLSLTQVHLKPSLLFSVLVENKNCTLKKDENIYLIHFEM